ncbi:MAG: putative DNA binding domain-containing protein, partial [Coriobacteriales bacterium]|nr:putative DNA binding domain-containing protein [Coriobacteriales bacterium]
MAIPTNIKTLLSGQVVEWARIEFKKAWDPAKSLKTICAFANDIDNWGGGYVVIGVDSDEKTGLPIFPVQGVPSASIDRMLKDILNKCKLIQPDYLPIVEVADYQKKKLVVIWAPGGYLRPYSSPKTLAKTNIPERVNWIRKMSSSIKPTEEEKRDLYGLANHIPFDDRINHEAELSDLNFTLIKSYLKEIDSALYAEADTMDFLELCKSMNIVNMLPEYTKPKNVGLMFFCPEPQRFFPYDRIDVVEFPDEKSGDKIIENIFEGPIHEQLLAALRYIRG